MKKVTVYIDTNGTKRYKKFLLSPFSTALITKWFAEWFEKDNGTFSHPEENMYLVFNDNNYHIQRNSVEQINVHTLPLPRTLNDFINDMFRYDITLYWSDSILEILDPKDIYSPENIRKHYKILLEKMNKGFELP